MTKTLPTMTNLYLIIRHVVNQKEFGSSNGVFEKHQANLNMASVEAGEGSLDVGI